MQSVELNVIPSGKSPTIYLSKNDVGRQFELILTDNGMVYEPPSDAVISLKARDRERNLVELTPKYQNGSLIVTTTSELTELDGTVVGDIVIKSGNTSITTQAFLISIERGT